MKLQMPGWLVMLCFVSVGINTCQHEKRILALEQSCLRAGGP
jgi:hypothetical protein